MTHRGPFQPLLFCDSVILCDPITCSHTVEKGKGIKDLQEICSVKPVLVSLTTFQRATEPV